MKTSCFFPFRVLLAAISITALSVFSTQAAAVTFEVTNLNGSPTATSVVLNDYTNIGALNIAASGTTPPNRTINGVTFEPGARATTGSKTFTSSGLTIDWGVTGGTGTVDPGVGTRSGIINRYTGDFQEVMKDIIFSRVNGAITLSLSGLQAGQEYRVQFLLDDLNRTSTDLAMSISVTGTGNSGSTSSFTYGMSGGKSVLATFTTDIGQTSIGFSLNAATDSRAVFSGVSVSAIPEPGTAMFGLFAAGMLLLRRQRVRRS